ncbi:Unknown protein sequence [Pseudomonas syringae pv. maculicola]|nr:Unknown protein sequence [Pseudomonas syringae pv. maculicola]
MDRNLVRRHFIETPSQKRSRIVRDSTFVLKHTLSRSRH